MTIFASGCSRSQSSTLSSRGWSSLDAGAFRHLHLDQHLGPVRGREELLLDPAHSDDGEHDYHHDGASAELVAHGRADHAAQAAIVRRVVDRVVAALDRLDVGQHLDAEIGREDHRDEPRCDQREADDPEDIAGIFAGGRPAKPTGIKPMTVTSVPDSIGAAVWLQA